MLLAIAVWSVKGALPEIVQFYVNGPYPSGVPVVSYYRFDALDEDGDFSEFTFVHLTDVHMGAKGLWEELDEDSTSISTPPALLRWSAWTRFTDAIDEILTDVHPQPDFILDTGDVANRANKGFYKLYLSALLPLKERGIEVYVVPGNHDRYSPILGYSGDRDLETFSAWINEENIESLKNVTSLMSPGPEDEHRHRLYNYTFEHKGFLFVGLNSGGDWPLSVYLPPGYGSGLANEQIHKENNEYAGALANLDPTEPKVIFMHHTAVNKYNEGAIDNNRDAFVSYCNNWNVQLVLTGHTHEAHAFTVDSSGTIGDDCEDNLDSFSEESFERLEPLFIQTQSAGKDSTRFKHGYRVIEVKDGQAIPHSHQVTGTRTKRLISLFSAGNLNVCDSQGRHTGTIEGQYELNIPRSFYFESYTITSPDGAESLNTPETVMLYDTSEAYRYGVEGTDVGTYTLAISSVEEEETSTFTATDIPISPGAVHQYTLDWDALAQGGEGVTLRIDSDGDEVFEQTVTADAELTAEEIEEPGIVPAGESLSIGPNPVPDTGTAFFYTLPVGTSMAKLMVLSATTGRLLFETSIDVNETRFPASGTWDPVDNDGVKLANGPYLYVLIANGQLIGQGKMVIQR